MGYGSTVQSSDTVVVNMIILPAKHSEVWDTEVGAGGGRIKFVDKKRGYFRQFGGFLIV